MKESAGWCSLACLAIIALSVLWWAVGGFILMLAWNLLAPLFGLPVMTYLQGVAAAVIIYFVGGAFRSITTSKS